ncbi:MAG: hypothetical protein JWM88_2658 [Verrucomicrobia bacterium]|nr:hypothetical protein [Verrucomicrobiota bacterium]
MTNRVFHRIPSPGWILIVAVCLGFAGFTGHMWEDYFITFRASLNLATGHGLVFQPGEHVHTFTSPLGTLLPALLALGDGAEVAVRALWLFRIVSAVALASAIALAARTMTRSGLAPFALVAACAAWSLDPKTVDFSINGMETALLVLFIVAAWRALADGARLLPTAVAFAGLQWTRPDGCVFFAALAAGWLVFGATENGPGRAERLGRLVRGVALGGVAYLPWVAFAWWYYGSPLPHTIMAKVSHHGPGELGPALLLYPWRLLFGHTALHDVFMPAYSFFGGWPPALAWYSRVVVVIAAGGWLVPAMRPAGRMASLAFFLGGFYVEYIPRSPWYYPGWQALALVASAFLLDAALRTDLKPRAQGFVRLARGAGIIFVTVQAALLASVAWQMREQQSIIENGHRREIGLWLRAHAAKGDRVYLEPLGYVGYFSGLKMLDYPGLSSPEVVAARRAGHRPHADLIAVLQPEWLVLRPDQARGIAADRPELLTKDYRLEHGFDVRAQVDSIRFLPGRGYLDFDAVYLVFQRTAQAAAPR